MFRKFVIDKARFCVRNCQISNELTEKMLSSDHCLTISQIQKAIGASPTLKHIPTENWNSCFEIFSSQGIKTTQFLDIVAKQPQFLTAKTRDILKHFEAWHSLQFGAKQLVQLITTYPELLDKFEEKTLVSQITFLRKFALSTKNVWKLIMNSPNVLVDNPFDIEEKFDYLQDEMGVTVNEIVKSPALDRTVTEIHARHEFLKRLGLYKLRSPKTHANEPNKNPKLSDIFGTSNSVFAKKVCGVSLEEFEMFESLYQREKSKNEIDDLPSEGKENYNRKLKNREKET